jgi:hypothetical protein
VAICNENGDPCSDYETAAVAIKAADGDIEALGGSSDAAAVAGGGGSVIALLRAISRDVAAKPGWSYKHIVAGQATTVVKTTAGVLHAIVFHAAATATNVTTIYDGVDANGFVIGIPAATAVTFPTTVIFDLSFTQGLTIVTATANGCDMTIVYA